MSAATVKPPPNAPATWVCVECGRPKSEHDRKRLWCLPLVLLPADAPWARDSSWRQFR